MPILYIIVVFVVVGLVLYLINSYIPMEPRIKSIMNIAVVVIMVLWLLQLVFPGLLGLRVGHPQ